MDLRLVKRRVHAVPGFKKLKDIFWRKPPRGIGDFFNKRPIIRVLYLSLAQPPPP